MQTRNTGYTSKNVTKKKSMSSSTPLALCVHMFARSSFMLIHSVDSLCSFAAVCDNSTLYSSLIS